MKISLSILFCVTIVMLASATIDIPSDYATIQEGINAATTGDTVLVQPGTYQEGINFHGRRITVASLYTTTEDTTYISSTVIDGNSSVLHVVEFTAYETNASKLIGFTITGGCANGSETNDMRGGCIFVSGASPVISHCIITGNHAEDYGGGVSWAMYDIHLHSCRIANNSAGTGGGGMHLVSLDEVDISNCDVCFNIAPEAGGLIFLGQGIVMTKTRIHDNTVSGNGGGIFIIGDGYLEECLLYNNSGMRGGAAFIDPRSIITDGPLSIRNCTIFNNTSFYNGGALFCQRGSSSVLVNTILYGNQPQEIAFADTAATNTLAVAYCDVEGGETGVVTNGNADIDWLDGNIDADPLFADPESGDCSLTENSPCIDAGTAHFTYDGATYVNLGSDEYYGNAPDIGAEEYNPSAVHEGTTPPAPRLNLRAYPNPFNPTTQVCFSLPRAAAVRLCAYNVRGQRVATLVDEPMPAGEHTAQWNATGLASGVYLLRLNAGGRQTTQRAVLLK